jgi:hypothetical protein
MRDRRKKGTLKYYVLLLVALIPLFLHPFIPSNLPTIVSK